MEKFNRQQFIEGEEKERGEKKIETSEKQKEVDQEEVDQAKIAQKYLQEYKHYQDLNESYQRTLRSLDKLREESILGEDSPIVQKLEEELKYLSRSMDRSQEISSSLSSQLSEKSKEKYLKP